MTNNLNKIKYKPVIGLEVHVELKTKSKMFCRCSADYFGKKPNTHTCAVCLGLPGALPYPNKKAIEWCIKIALSLNCQINEFSKFDRKNYFYPDLPKGYQISQYDLPFGFNGYIEVPSYKNLKGTKKIRIRRVHMEEDTGKLFHAVVDGEKVSLIDFNRSGVPLVEIVTEPDFGNEYQVLSYLQKLQKIVRYLDVSNADMEKGDMRLEPNISLQRSDSNNLPNFKVEVKNINSFRFVEKAIKYEVERQTKLLDLGEIPVQETRGWNEFKNKTVSQRSKEEAHDYRYFPEPDIPPITHTKNQILKIKDTLGELPDQKQKKFESEFRLSTYDAEILARSKEIAFLFEAAVTEGKFYEVTPKEIANIIINQKIDAIKSDPKQIIKQIILSKKKDEIGEKELDNLIRKVMEENKRAVEEYKKGKENVLMFLLGQVLRKSGKKLDPQLVKENILKKIST